ncbi:MAG: formate dehydrogenase [Burkholderiaceae bacterium]
MKKSKPFQSDRRRALRGLATSPALAAGAAAVVSGSASAEPVADPTPEVTADKGYQETKHVRDYYRTASF